MPSNQLTRALKSRTDLPERVIENISEKEGWDIIYTVMNRGWFFLLKRELKDNERK